jgi:hypothetical protein
MDRGGSGAGRQGGIMGRRVRGKRDRNRDRDIDKGETET